MFSWIWSRDGMLIILPLIVALSKSNQLRCTTFPINDPVITSSDLESSRTPNYISRFNRVRRDVYDFSIHRYMTMTNDLAGSITCRSNAHTVNYVVSLASTSLRRFSPVIPPCGKHDRIS